MRSGQASSSVALETVTESHRADSRRYGRRQLHIALVVGDEPHPSIFVLSPNKPVTLGRAPSANHRIEHPTVSREHARFTFRRAEGHVWVEDLASKNGTIVEGARVERAAVPIGEEVMLGSVVVRVQVLGERGQLVGPVGEPIFRRQVEEELERSRQFRRRFALLLVRDEENREPALCSKLWWEIVQANVRSVDRVARYGGCAVEVLLPEASAEDAERIARSLLTALEQNQVRALVGVAPYPEAGTTPDQLIEAARESSHRASRAAPIQVAGRERDAHGSVTAAQDIFLGGLTMRSLLRTVENAAQSRIPLILHGETGTGKEIVARMIHERGPRSSRRMVRVNCAAIPKDLVESTLFGHERGSFTGAVSQQKGVFEEADGSTVLLDEIGELPAAAQAALLRVLEVGTFSRVGSSRELEVDVRVVAATHRDLEAMAQSGAFRSDLYYRLSGMVVEIPPLRERQDEIEPLAKRFLSTASVTNNRNVDGVTPEALDVLRAYGWPGNIRELKNAMERAVIVARGTLIGVEDLPAKVRRMAPHTDTAHGSAQGPIRGKMQEYESKLLRDAMHAAHWNRSEAAKMLGMPLRTLSYRLQVLGLKRPT